MPVTLHNLVSAPKTRGGKRLGRGNASGKGTYSSRGIKGQKARAGSGGMRRRSLMRALIKKIPKLGGFRPRHAKTVSVTLATVEKRYADGETIGRASLVAKKILTARETRGAIKLIGATTIKKHFIVEKGIGLSKQARSSIEKKSAHHEQ